MPVEPPSFPAPKVEEEVKGKSDPKKAAAPAKGVQSKDKLKEEEVVKPILGPKYKFGKFKKDG